jgi:lysine-N-methylase
MYHRVMVRPRLGDHVQARWQRIGDEPPFVVLHDEDGLAIRLGAREWAVVRAADGTRDEEGIQLAAAHDGAKVSLREVAEFVRALGQHGLFAEAPRDDSEPAFARDVPVRQLPGFRLACDGRGACCRSFGTILFRPIDIARARAAVPELDPVFMPERGLRSELCAVEQHDGACAYLDTDGLCRIHAEAGASAKPIGCRTFPARFLDVGHEIRVSPRLECACIFASARGERGEPLSRAQRGSEIEREVYVPSLAASSPVGGEPLPRAALVALCDSLEVPEQGDLAVLLWVLGSDVGPQAALRRVAESAERLIARASWRAPSDHVLRAAKQVRAAAASAARELPAEREREDETFYLRASYFAILGAERTFEADLRRLALVMWIARAFEPETAHPIALVEMLGRGHGLDLDG